MSLIPISVVGIAFQVLVRGLYLEVFCTTFPILLITLIIQKPEEIIHTTTGTMNSVAFEEEIRRNFVSKLTTQILFIKLENFTSIKNQFSETITTSFQKSLIKRLSLICGTDETEVYTLEDGFYGIVSLKNQEDLFSGVAEAICRVLKESQRIGQVKINLDSRLCLAGCPQDLQDFDTFQNFRIHFDTIITERNTVIHLSDIASSKDFLVRTNLDDIIKNAITEKKFQMYYQPIYNIQKKKFTSAEALIRLIDDKYGFVSPGLFIPAAEQSGAIHQIGDFVFEDVCRFISSCDFEALGLEYIEINLSVAQAIEFELPEKLQSIMQKYNVSPDKINLEITETAADFNPVVFDRNIGTINKMGIQFSLDDYGTGYSNIKRVTTLPLSIIKLDKSFVDEYKKEQMNIIIRENVAMLKKIHKLILVEGVEEEEQFRLFETLGCNYIQGFYFSKPLPEKDYLAFVSQKNAGVAL